MIAIKWEMGLTGMHDFNLGTFIVKHIVRGIIYCWKDITWGIVSQGFSLRGTFFACHWHRTGKKIQSGCEKPNHRPLGTWVLRICSLSFVCENLLLFLFYSVYTQEFFSLFAIFPIPPLLSAITCLISTSVFLHTGF